MSKRSKYLKKANKSSRARRYRPRPSKRKKNSRPSRTYYLKPLQKRKKIAFGILAFLVFAGLFYLFGYSPVFEIKKITVEREENIYSGVSNAEIEGFLEPFLHTRRFLVFPQNNVLFFNGQMAERIVRKNLIVESFKIHRRWKIIRIEIKEKLPKAVLLNKESYYYLDGKGLVLRKVLESKYDRSLPLISDKMETPVELLEERLDEPTVSFVIEAEEKFRQKFNGETAIASFEISEPTNPDIVVQVSEGWKIYLNKTGSAAEQIDNLKLVLDEEVKEQRPNLEYIDLRLGNRVFYKPKTQTP